MKQNCNFCGTQFFFNGDTRYYLCVLLFQRDLQNWQSFYGRNCKKESPSLMGSCAFLVVDIVRSKTYILKAL